MTVAAMVVMVSSLWQWGLGLVRTTLRLGRLAYRPLP